MSEVNSVTSEAESLNPIEVEQENPLTSFFQNEISRQIAELQEIDRRLTFVFNTCSLIQGKYCPQSEISEELYSQLRQNMTRCENVWRQAMAEKELDPKDAILSAKERLTGLILGNRIQVLSLTHMEGLNPAEKYKLILKVQKWICHMRLLLTYIAFSAKSLKQEDVQKVKEVLKNKTPSLTLP